MMPKVTFKIMIEIKLIDFVIEMDGGDLGFYIKKIIKV